MAYPQTLFPSVTLHPDTLLFARRKAAAQQTLHYQLSVLKSTGRYDAFKLNWHPIYSEPVPSPGVPKHLFWDSDIGKWLEGACYILLTTPPSQRDPTILAAVDELVPMIASAQQLDGYLNIHYSVVAPGQRFTNIRDMHELYNAGHLLEAALAHAALVHPQPSLLLQTMLRYVDLLCTLFGPSLTQQHGYPGHPEIELALLRLHAYTREPKHLALARYFILERGNPTGCFERHFYRVEAERRGEDPRLGLRFSGKADAWWYMQAHVPIVEQTGVEGHSVRAMYLLAAAADLCLQEGDKVAEGKLLPAIRRLWDDMVGRKMYVTGGIGAMKQWEGFGLPYFLPQSAEEGGCYVETCAAIGVMMLAERLLRIELDGAVGDVMELALYNAVLTGMSCDGKKFTYWNPLGSSDGALAEREEWFDCACCPPNVLRLLGQIGGYAYSQREAEIDVHLFISSTGTFKVGAHDVRLTQESNYPWSGDIKFTLETTANDLVGLNIRIPGWAKDEWSISPPLPSSPTAPLLRSNYLHLPPTYLHPRPNAPSTSTFTLTLPLHPRHLSPHPYASHPSLTLARGPIIYCVEDVDNPWVLNHTFSSGDVNPSPHAHFRSLQIDPSFPITEALLTDAETAETYVGLTLARGGASLLDLEAVDAAFRGGRGPGVDVSVAVGEDAQDQEGRWARGIPLKGELRFVPYYFRANRRGSRGVSRVGLRWWVR